MQLLQQGQCSLRENVSRKGRRLGILSKQVSKEAVLESYGNHERDGDGLL